MEKIYAGIVGILLAIAGLLGIHAKSPSVGGIVAPEAVVATKEAEQANYLQTTGKYVHVPRGQCATDIECWVDELEHSDGSRGYVVYELRTNADGSVDKKITSHDRDVLTTGWVQVKAVVIATSTPI